MDTNVQVSNSAQIAQNRLLADGWHSVADVLPPSNGYYICWCTNEPGLIHYHSATGWQNGFYDEVVTHWMNIVPPTVS